MTKVTIKDVAHEADVSVGMVSMVLNGKVPAGSKKAEKILKVARALKYLPNKSASALRQGYRKTIGVITPDLANHYFSDISRHIENIAYKSGYMVLFGSSDDLPEKMHTLIETFISDGVCGLLITPCENCEDSLRMASDLGIPVVLMNRDLATLDNVGKVFLDNDKAVRDGISHLVANGYRNIGMLSHDMTLSTLNTREQSYMAAMEEIGLGQYARIDYATLQYDEESLKAQVLQAHERGVEALFVPRGYLTLYVYNAIKALGLRIPEDMAVIGFDGGLTFDIATPSISQLVQRTTETAEKAFAMLYDLTTKGKPMETVLIDPVLKAGGSTAPRKP